MALNGAGQTVDLDASTLDIDASSTVDVNGTAVTIDGSGVLTLGGSSVDVDADGGALSLDGSTGLNIGTNADQPIDMDASTLDIDVSGAITIDATTTTFVGDVKGPKATAMDEFVTYEQLDSLANSAPYNETYKAINLGTTATQTITVAGGLTRLNLTGAPGYYYDNSYSVDYPAVGVDPAYSTQLTGGPGGGQYVDLDQPGVYEVHLTMELTPIASPGADAKVLVEIKNNDPAPVGATPNPMTVASDTEIVYDTEFGGGSCHMNMSMIFITENNNEDVYVDVTTVGEDVIVQSFKFSITRIGNQ
jgi:hypothetical protein